jgi:hypothetical protein
MGGVNVVHQRRRRYDATEKDGHSNHKQSEVITFASQPTVWPWLAAPLYLFSAALHEVRRLGNLGESWDGWIPPAS